MADATIEYTSTGSGSKSYSAYAYDSCNNKDYGTWYWGGDSASKGQDYVLGTAGLTFSQSNGKFTLTGPTNGNAPDFNLVWKSPKVNNGAVTYTVAVVFKIPTCIITDVSSSGLMHKGQQWTFTFAKNTLSFSNVSYNKSGPQSISVTWYPQGQDTSVTTTQEYSLDVSASGSTIEISIEMTNDGGHSGGNLMGTAQGVLDAVNNSCENGDDGCTCVTLSLKDQTIDGVSYKGTTSFGACLGYVKPNVSSGGGSWQNAYLKFYAFGIKVGSGGIPRDLPECK